MKTIRNFNKASTRKKNYLNMLKWEGNIKTYSSRTCRKKSS